MIKKGKVPYNVLIKAIEMVGHVFNNCQGSYTLREFMETQGIFKFKKTLRKTQGIFIYYFYSGKLRKVLIFSKKFREVFIFEKSQNIYLLYLE